MSDDVTTCVLAYLEAKRPLPGATEAEKLDCDYLATGHVDSVGILDMVGHFEQQFGIRFSMDDLQAPSFGTPRGVIAAVERLLAQSDRAPEAG